LPGTSCEVSTIGFSRACCALNVERTQQSPSEYLTRKGASAHLYVGFAVAGSRDVPRYPHRCARGHVLPRHRRGLRREDLIGRLLGYSGGVRHRPARHDIIVRYGCCSYRVRSASFGATRPHLQCCGIAGRGCRCRSCFGTRGRMHGQGRQHYPETPSRRC